MKGLIQYCLVVGIVGAVVVGGMFLFGTTTGCRDLFCTGGQDENIKVNWSNLSPDDKAFASALATSVFALPVALGTLIFFSMIGLPFIVSRKTKIEKQNAIDMEEQGAGTRLW